MKKNLKALTSILLVAVLTISAVLVSPQFFVIEASESQDELYLIYSVEDLKRVGNDEEWTLNKNYMLMEDISFETQDSDISNFTPIGTLEEPFTGIFDGNNKTISGLKIVYEPAQHIGLFGAIEGESAAVKNLTIKDAEIKSSGNTESSGILVGSNDGNILNCHVEGTIISSSNSGGISGINGKTGIIENCSSTAFIFGDTAGGITGTNIGFITQCYFIGNISGSEYAGGIAGFHHESIISKCSSKGTILGNDYAGGIVGFTGWEAVINRCYSTSGVSGKTVGGILGYSLFDVIIKDCYSTGTIIGFLDVGGLVGFACEAKIENCYSTSEVQLVEDNLVNYCEVGGIIGATLLNPEINNCVAANSLINTKYLSWMGGFDKIGYLLLEEECLNNNIAWNDMPIIHGGRLLSYYYDDSYLLNVRDKSKEELTKKTTYEELGWSFSGSDPVWEFEGEYKLPKLVGVRGQEDLITPLHLQHSNEPVEVTDSTEAFSSETTQKNFEVIIDIKSLEDNCDIVGDIWSLRPGTYVIPSDVSCIDIDDKTLVIGEFANLIVGPERNHSDICLFVDTIILRENGSIIANGSEKGYYNFSIYVYETFTQNNGSITAYGGSGEKAFAIVAETFIQKGGIITAKGGRGNSADGIVVWTDFIQEDGTIIATGSGATFNCGINANSRFIQKGGTIKAQGGEDNDTFGIYTVAFIQEKGLIIAGDGEGMDAYGIYIYDSLIISDTLVIKPMINSSAIYTYGEENETFGITFKNTSNVILEYDSFLPEERRVGKIEVESNSFQIEEGATLIVEIKNPETLTLSQGDIDIFLITSGNSNMKNTGNFTLAGDSKKIFNVQKSDLVYKLTVK